ncbi:hypothetical protein EIK77_001981 [Talaromyces pinophilus]|nr:hypothetical protein EIK77_001981 [Talaromyces pinophilus]
MSTVIGIFGESLCSVTARGTRQITGGHILEVLFPSVTESSIIATCEQPDLNWENPRVREAVHEIVRYWLDHGADGFRMDVINFISKDQSFPNAAVTNPDSPWQSGKEYYAAGPRLHEYLQRIGKLLKEYDAFSVGEMLDVEDPAQILKAVGQDRDEINMAFHFEIYFVPSPHILRLVLRVTAV